MAAFAVAACGDDAAPGFSPEELRTSAVQNVEITYGDYVRSWGDRLGFDGAAGTWSAQERGDGIWRVTFAADETPPVRAAWDVELPVSSAHPTTAEIERAMAREPADPTPVDANARRFSRPVSATPLPGSNVRLVVELRATSPSGRQLRADVLPAAKLPRSIRETADGDLVLTRGLTLLDGKAEPVPATLRLRAGADVRSADDGQLTTAALGRLVRRDAPVLAYVRVPDAADATRWLRDGSPLPVDQLVVAER